MHEMSAVEDLKPGDYIDLENDRFADPFGAVGYHDEEDDPNYHDWEADHMYFECEYVVVEAVVEEDEDKTCLYSEAANVLFPHGHKVRRYVPSDEDERDDPDHEQTWPASMGARIAGQPATFEVHVDGMAWADQDGVTQWNRSDADEMADRLEQNGFDNNIQVVPVTE